jgi:hypothetical protein
MYAYYERYAYEMALVRGMPMRWPMRDAYGMASVRSAPMRDAPMGWPPMRDTL